MWIDPETKERHFWRISSTNSYPGLTLSKTTVEYLAQIGVVVWDGDYEDEGIVMHYYRKAD